METLLKAKKLIDVIKQTVVSNPVIFVRDGMIQKVYTKQNLQFTKDKYESWKVVDLLDATLLPGLINSHVHACFPADGSPFSAINDRTDATLLAIALENARRALLSGVTTLRDCGDRNGVMAALRQAIQEGYAIGPRVVLSGTPLTTTGGHCHSFGGEVDGADNVTRAVRQRVKEGADFIRIMATGGSMGGIPWLAAFDLPELRAAVKAAHRLDKKVGAHCRGLPGMELAIEAGIDHMEHASFELPDGNLQFDPRIADKLAEKHIFVTPTIGFRRDFLEAHQHRQNERMQDPPCQKLLDNTARQLEQKYICLQGMLKAGVLCVAGDDAGLPHTRADRFYRELEAMQIAGMPGMQILVSATCLAAKAMGLEDCIGSLEPGKTADIIAVNGDPLQSINALTQLRMVMKEGNIVFHNPA